MFLSDDANDELWSSICDYPSLIAANILFIRRVLPSTPDHHGPLAAESTSLIPTLIGLNSLGVVTSSSQPHGHFKTYDGRNSIQRPYLRFWYPKPMVNKLVDKLLVFPDYRIIITETYSGKSTHKGFIPEDVQHMTNHKCQFDPSQDTCEDNFFALKVIVTDDGRHIDDFGTHTSFVGSSCASRSFESDKLRKILDGSMMEIMIFDSGISNGNKLFDDLQTAAWELYPETFTYINKM